MAKQKSADEMLLLSLGIGSDADDLLRTYMRVFHKSLIFIERRF